LLAQDCCQKGPCHRLLHSFQQQQTLHQAWHIARLQAAHKKHKKLVQGCFQRGPRHRLLHSFQQQQPLHQAWHVAGLQAA
jgi:hypothetical protein